MDANELILVLICVFVFKET